MTTTASILDFLPFVLTADQNRALKQIEAFLDLTHSDDCFALRGGTGKTPVLKAVVNFLQTKQIDFQLMAPTGKAAQVLGNITASRASTIHLTIYWPICKAILHNKAFASSPLVILKAN